MAAQILDERSVLSSKSELSLFSLPPTQVAIESGYWHCAHPRATVTTMGPYEFQMPPDPMFIDLGRNYIRLSLKILKTDGTDLIGRTSKANGTPQYFVAPMNMIGATFFKQIKLFLNNKVVYDSGELNAYRAYMETLLGFGKQAKKTHLQAGMYYEDTAGEMETEANVGWNDRAEWCDKSRTFEMFAPIHTDISNQERLIIPYMDVRLELFRNTDNWLLLSLAGGAKYKIKVVDIVWYVRRVDVLKSMALGLEACLARETAKYPLRRVVMKTLHIEKGRRELPETWLCSGQVPRRLVLGFVDAKAYNGDQRKNGFNFQHFFLQSMQVTAGGVTYPRNPWNLDFEEGRYTQAYVALFEALNMVNDDKSNGISYKDFANGMAFFAVDLSPDSSDSDHWELIKTGSTYLKLQFSKDTPDDGIKVIVFAEYDNLLTIDKHRNVFFDYTL